jgi:hypothetical protein
MKVVFTLAFSIIFSSVVFSSQSASHGGQNHRSFFIENKGQLQVETGGFVSEVKYYADAGGFFVYCRSTGVSYQVYASQKQSENKTDETQLYRVDVNFAGAKKNCQIISENPSGDLLNYHCDGNAISSVKSFAAIIYKDLYPGIDLRYYMKDGSLKYDFIVAPFVDPGRIKLQVIGSNNITLTANGDINIQTPLNDIIENAPQVFQGKKRIRSSWILNGNVISFKTGKYDPSQELLIDPVTRVWSSYFGGMQMDAINDIKTDKKGRIYITGRANFDGTVLLSTPGVFQTVPSGADSYLAKFDSAGNRIWCTYVGASNWNAQVYSVDVDTTGNIFICGEAYGTGTALATPGAFQLNAGGLQDAFLAKFDSTGQRIWSTYYGGAYSEIGYSCATDLQGNIFICGLSGTGTANIMYTPGAFQSAFGTTFLAKFDGSGNRIWGTNFSGSCNSPFGDIGCCTDRWGNIYMAGRTFGTNTPTRIASPQSHQSAFGGGGSDAYIVKFSGSGQRRWGSFYGGAGSDVGTSCSVDQNGNVYLTGYADSVSSPSAFATTGCHQGAFGGGYSDGFIAKFDSTGNRLWGSYYGGNSIDRLIDCSVDVSGNLFVTGYTYSTNGPAIATFNTFQSNFGGAAPNGNFFNWGDAILAQFDVNGVRLWSTYYGGNSEEGATSCANGADGSILMAGSTVSSGTIMATPGAFQQSLSCCQPQGVLSDGFFVKFESCPDNAPLNITYGSNSAVCASSSTTLNVVSGAPVMWYASLTSSTIIGTGSSFYTGSLSAGVYTWFAGSRPLCSDSLRTPCQVTVFPQPTVTAANASICTGQTYTFVTGGASTYVFSSIWHFVSPVANTQYTVTGYDANGCKDDTTCTVFVLPAPNPTITTTSNFACAGSAVVLTATGGVAYQWVNGPSTNTMMINAITQANYSLHVTGANSCTSNAVFTQFVISCVGIDENSETAMSIHPNPATNEINIKGCSGCFVEIFDSGGKLIQSWTSVENDQKKELSEQSPGVYCVRLRGGAQTQFLKLVVLK